MDREGRPFFLPRSHRENLVRVPFDLPRRGRWNDPAEPSLDLEVKGIAQGQSQLLSFQVSTLGEIFLEDKAAPELLMAFPWSRRPS